jgi:hypothetical protein
LTNVLERIVSGAAKNSRLHELLVWNWKAARSGKGRSMKSLKRRRRATAKPSKTMVDYAVPLDRLDLWSRAMISPQCAKPQCGERHSNRSGIAAGTVKRGNIWRAQAQKCLALAASQS